MYPHAPLSNPRCAGFALCVPVYNDWACVSHLLQEIDRVAGQFEGPVNVLIVNDGSSEEASLRIEPTLRHIAAVEILHLRRNVGHQRAIALGLAYLHCSRPDRLTVVMDGDGEDDPRRIEELLARKGLRR